MKIYSFCKLLLLFSLLTPLSCTPNGSKDLDNRDQDLYNRSGFRPGTAPVTAKNRNAGVRVTPDYYYRTADKKVRPKRKLRKRTHNVLSIEYEPSSRHYNNPYSFKPPMNFPYFDSDQYYVPPNGYNGTGRDSHFDEPVRKNAPKRGDDRLY